MAAPQTAEKMEQDQSGNGLASWGRRLRAEREAKGLSSADVAAQLRLELKLIEAIEAEDLQALPLSSFVKGYLRGYSRFLEIEVEPIISAYDQVSGSGEPKIAKVSRMRDTNSKDGLPKAATWIVVAVVILSLFWWWKGELLSHRDVTESTVQTEEPQLMGNTFGGADINVSQGVFEQPIEAQIEASRPEVIAPPTETSAEVSQPVVPAGVEAITLNFSAESWVKIYDAQDTRLFLNTGKSGDSRTVEGVAPFKVTLGNSKGVVLTYKGEIFDHSQYDVKGVAIFTLE